MAKGPCARAGLFTPSESGLQRHCVRAVSSTPHRPGRATLAAAVAAAVAAVTAAVASHTVSPDHRQTGRHQNDPPCLVCGFDTDFARHNLADNKQQMILQSTSSLARHPPSLRTARRRRLQFAELHTFFPGRRSYL